MSVEIGDSTNAGLVQTA